MKTAKQKTDAVLKREHERAKLQGVRHEEADCYACGDLGFMRSDETKRLVMCPMCNGDGSKCFEIAKLADELQELLERVRIVPAKTKVRGSNAR